eukprot:2243249-Prymnesium_polylepis.1
MARCVGGDQSGVSVRALWPRTESCSAGRAADDGSRSSIRMIATALTLVSSVQPRRRHAHAASWRVVCGVVAGAAVAIGDALEEGLRRLRVADVKQMSSQRPERTGEAGVCTGEREDRSRGCGCDVKVK